MLQKNNSLVAEGVVEVVDHIPWSSLKAKLPEENLIFENCRSRLFPVIFFFVYIFHFAQIPSLAESAR